MSKTSYCHCCLSTRQQFTRLQHFNFFHYCHETCGCNILTTLQVKTICECVALEATTQPDALTARTCVTEVLEGHEVLGLTQPVQVPPADRDARGRRSRRNSKQQSTTTFGTPCCISQTHTEVSCTATTPSRLAPCSRTLPTSHGSHTASVLFLSLRTGRVNSAQGALCWLNTLRYPRPFQSPQRVQSTTEPSPSKLHTTHTFRRPVCQSAC